MDYFFVLYIFVVILVYHGFFFDLSYICVTLFVLYCKDTDYSPHLDGNKGWAQQAQYNKFMREWVKKLGW